MIGYYRQGLAMTSQTINPRFKPGILDIVQVHSAVLGLTVHTTLFFQLGLHNLNQALQERTIESRRRQAEVEELRRRECTWEDSQCLARCGVNGAQLGNN